MRQMNWKNIAKLYPEFYRMMKQKCVSFYLKSIRRHINEQKTLDIERFEERADFKQVLCVVGDLKGDILDIVKNEMAVSLAKTN